MSPDPVLESLESIPLLKEILAEEMAVLLPSNETQEASMSLLGDAEWRRAWAESIPENASDLITFLEHYTSVKNTEPCKTVTDPMASMSVKKGLWRQVSVIKTKHLYPDGGEQHRNVIIQVLRRGYIESLVSDGNLDWSEARLHEGKLMHPGTYDTGCENYLTVKWMNVSPFRAKAIADSINGLAVSSFAPVIKGEAYDTGYHRLHCDYRIEEDGSASIYLFLAHPEFTLYAFSNWRGKGEKDVIYFWNVPKELAQGVLDLYRAKGKSATCNYNSNQALVDIIIYETNFSAEIYTDVVARQNCDSIMYADYYWGVEDPTAYSIAGLASAGWTYERRIDPQADGYDIVILRTQTQHRAYDTRWANYSSLVEVSQYQQLGAPSEAYIPDVTGVGVGGIYDVNVRPRDDCSLDIMTSYERGKEVTLLGQRVRTSYVELADRDRYWNLVTPVEATSDAIGYIYDANNDINRFGLYDSSHAVRTARAREVAAAAISDTALATSLRSQSVNAAAPIAAETFTAGYIYEANSALNDFGLYDGGKISRTAKAAGVGATQTRGGVLATVDTTVSMNAASAVAASGPAAGFIYETRNSYNDFGLYDSVSTTTTANAVSFLNKRVEARLDQEVYEDVYRNADTPLDTPAAAPGFIYDMQNAINEFGLYDIRQQRRNATALTFESVLVDSGLSDVNEIFYRNNSAIISAPAPSQGQIYQVSVDLNAFGLYDGRLTNTVSVENDVYIAWPTRYGNASLHVLRNQRELPTAELAALTGATNNSVSASINQDDTYDLNISKQPHAWGGATFVEKEYYWRYKTAGQGKQFDVYIYLSTDLDYIEDWLYDTRNTNMSGTTIDSLGGNKWRGVKVLEVA